MKEFQPSAGSQANPSHQPVAFVNLAQVQHSTNIVKGLRSRRTVFKVLRLQGRANVVDVHALRHSDEAFIATPTQGYRLGEVISTSRRPALVSFITPLVLSVSSPAPRVTARVQEPEEVTARLRGGLPSPPSEDEEDWPSKSTVPMANPGEGAGDDARMLGVVLGGDARAVHEGAWAPAVS